MIVVMKLQQFDFKPISFPLPIEIQTGKLKGFLPVYDNIEDAKEEFPDSDYVFIQRKEGE